MHQTDYPALFALLEARKRRRACLQTAGVVAKYAGIALVAAALTMAVKDAPAKTAATLLQASEGRAAW